MLVRRRSDFLKKTRFYGFFCALASRGVHFYPGILE